jgi:hypothetical protein
MSKEGTQFIATGIYIKHVLEQMKPGCKRSLLKVISCLFGTLLGGVISPPCCLQVTPERPGTNTVQGPPAPLHLTNQRKDHGVQFFSEIEEGAKRCQLNSQTR